MPRRYRTVLLRERRRLSAFTRKKGRISAALLSGAAGSFHLGSVQPRSLPAVYSRDLTASRRITPLRAARFRRAAGMRASSGGPKGTLVQRDPRQPCCSAEGQQITPIDVFRSPAARADVDVGRSHALTGTKPRSATREAPHLRGEMVREIRRRSDCRRTVVLGRESRQVVAVEALNMEANRLWYGKLG